MIDCLIGISLHSHTLEFHSFHIPLLRFIFDDCFLEF